MLQSMVLDILLHSCGIEALPAEFCYCLIEENKGKVSSIDNGRLNKYIVAKLR